MMRERSASFADAPALRITCASPRSIPKAEAGSMRASMQVTVAQRGQLVCKNGVSETKDVQTAYFFAGGSARWPCVNWAA